MFGQTLFVSLMAAGYFFTAIQVSGANEESRLYRVLFGSNYNRHVRPVTDYRRPVDVEVRLSLIEILGLDEITGRLMVKVWIILNWKDEYLMWNPAEHNDIKRLNVDTSPTPRIWLPDIAIFNAKRVSVELKSFQTTALSYTCESGVPAMVLDHVRESREKKAWVIGVHSDLQSSGQSSGSVIGEAGYLDGSSPPQAVVYFDGSVRWVRPAIVSITARHEFRANSWVATIRLGSWTHDDSRLRLRTQTAVSSGSVTAVDLDISDYAAGDQWTLVEHTGRRVEMAVNGKDGGGDHNMSPGRATVSGLDDCCQKSHNSTATTASNKPTSSVETFVTFNYGFKLRKKLGPSLLVSGRR